MFDAEALGAELAEMVRGHVAEATAPLLQRIQRLERQLTEEVAARSPYVPSVEEWNARFSALDEEMNTVTSRALEAARNIEEKFGAQGAEQASKSYVDEQGEALRSQVAEIRALVDAIPQPEPVDVQRLVDEAVARIPAPQDGAPGLDGKDGQDVTEEQLQRAVADYLAANPPTAGKDGRDGMDGAPSPVIAGALKSHDGELVLTFTDGTVMHTGIRDGLNGKDGKDGEPGERGFGLDDFDVEQPDPMTVRLKFARGDVLETYDLHFPVVIDHGVYKAGEDYRQGSGVTWAGSFWIAQKDTADRPGEGDSWRLAVKKGRDGKDADTNPLVRLIEDKFASEEERLIKRLEAFLRAKGLLG